MLAAAMPPPVLIPCPHRTADSEESNLSSLHGDSVWNQPDASENADLKRSDCGVQLQIWRCGLSLTTGEILGSFNIHHSSPTTDLRLFLSTSYSELHRRTTSCGGRLR